MHPGICRTELGRNRPLAADDSTLQRLATKMLAWGLGQFGQTPEQGAESVLMAAADPAVAGGALLGPSGMKQAFGLPAHQRPGKAASDATLATALWKRTEDLTGLRWSDVL